MPDLKLLPKKRLIITDNFTLLRQKLKELGLNTICQEARCPNIYECFSQKRLTFLILGNVCTRRCKFCSVSKGKPRTVDFKEPEKISRLVREFNIDYVVITSVTRDDLKDYGVSHFIEVIKILKEKNPEIKIEVLIPDFNARCDLISQIVDSGPDCIGHNLETVRRLANDIKDKASYEKSLVVLKRIKELNPNILTKSALLLGLGERQEEVLETIQDLKKVACDILVLGQYLRPDVYAIEVKRIIKEEEFKFYKDFAYQHGFKYIFAGTWMRSSNAILT